MGEAYKLLLEKIPVTRVAWNAPGKLEKWVELARPKDPELPLRLSNISGEEIMPWYPTMDDRRAEDWIPITEIRIAD